MPLTPAERKAQQRASHKRRTIGTPDEELQQELTRLYDAADKAGKSFPAARAFAAQIAAGDLSELQAIQIVARLLDGAGPITLEVTGKVGNRTEPRPGGYDPQMEGTKVCSRCSQERPVTDFYVNRRHRDGRTAHCRECHSRLYYRKEAIGA
jgi:hypothetical protein